MTCEVCYRKTAPWVSKIIQQAPPYWFSSEEQFPSQWINKNFKLGTQDIDPVKDEFISC